MMRDYVAPTPSALPNCDLTGQTDGRRNAEERPRRRRSASIYNGRKPSPACSARSETVEKRHHIRGLAAALFAHNGLLGMSMTALGRVAGVPPASMAYHYGKREELLIEVVSQHLDLLARQVSAACDASAETSPETQIEDMCLAFLDTAQSQPDAHFVAVHALCAVSASDRRAMKARWASFAETLGEPLTRLSPMLAAHPKIATMLAMSLIFSSGDAFLAFDPQDEIDRPAFARRLAAGLITAAQ